MVSGQWKSVIILSPLPLLDSARSCLDLRGTIRLSAGVTQLAECLLPKQNVVGSNPITRSPPAEVKSACLFQVWTG